jgi:Flp pilus assembly pilin Flp
MRELLRNIRRDCSGQEMIEYALLAALAAAVSASVFPLLLTSSGVFQHIYQLVANGLLLASTTGAGA